MADLGLPRWVVRSLDIGVLFTADAANVQRAPEVLVGSILFCDLRTLFDWRCDFDWCSVYDDVYSFLLPRLGAARLRKSAALFRRIRLKGQADLAKVWRDFYVRCRVTQRNHPGVHGHAPIVRLQRRA